MVYPKSSIVKQNKRVKITLPKFGDMDAFRGENNLNLNVSPYFYNVGSKGDLLTNAMGVMDAIIKVNGADHRIRDLNDIEKKMKNMWLFSYFDQISGQREDMLIYRDCENYFYSSEVKSESIPQILSSINCSSDRVVGLSYFYNSKDRFLLFNSGGGMYSYDGSEITNYPNVPPLSTACVHYDRVFGALFSAENKLCWSAPLNPVNWTESLTEGGYLKLVDEGGSINKVLSFKDYLFVFRDYAIHRMLAYGDQSDFSIVKAYTATGRIYENTITVCGDKIMFLAEDGLFCFDGYSVKRCFKNVTDIITDAANSCAAYFGGKYYLSLLGSYEDDGVHDEVKYTLKNNTVIAFDLTDGKISIMRGFDVHSFLVLRSKDYNLLLMSFRNDTGRNGRIAKISAGGKLFSVNFKKYWRSPRTDLGYLDREKMIGKVTIMSRYPVTLTLKGDNEKIINVAGADTPITVFTRVKGKMFEFSLYTEAENVEVSKIELEIDLM